MNLAEYWHLPIDAVLILVIVYLIVKPEGRDNLIWLFSGLLRAWLFGRRLRVRSDIQRNIEAFQSFLNQEVPNTASPGLTIQWVGKGETVEQFLKNGKIVIRLHDQTLRHKNLVTTGLLYMQGAVAPHGKRYLPATLGRAIDFCLTKRMLVRQREEGALRHLTNEIIDPELQSSEELKTYCVITDRLEDGALLRPILLPELESIGQRLHPREAGQNEEQELVGFVKFLDEMARREPGAELANFGFNRTLIRSQVLLVASPDTYKARGLKPYMQQIERAYREGVMTVYICARDEKTEIARQVAGACQELVYIASVTECRQIGRRPGSSEPVKVVIFVVQTANIWE